MIVLAVLVLVVATQSPAAPASPAPSPVAIAGRVSGRDPTAPGTDPAPDRGRNPAVVKQAPAFAAAAGRTDLQAAAAKRLPVPGVGDMGYFVEIQWKDKDGAAHTGLAVVAHTEVQDVPWMVKADRWGLVQVLEDKTIEGVVGELKRARLAANEAVAVGDIRTIYTAENLFMAVTNGAYGLLRCLHVPADCIVDIPGETLLEKVLTTATEKNGYRRKFHPGAPGAQRKGQGHAVPLREVLRLHRRPHRPRGDGHAGVLRGQHGADLRQRGRHRAAGRRRIVRDTLARS